MPNKLNTSDGQVQFDTIHNILRTDINRNVFLEDQICYSRPDLRLFSTFRKCNEGSAGESGEGNFPKNFPNSVSCVGNFKTSQQFENAAFGQKKRWKAACRHLRKYGYRQTEFKSKSTKIYLLQAFSTESPSL